MRLSARKLHHLCLGWRQGRPNGGVRRAGSAAGGGLRPRAKCRAEFSDHPGVIDRRRISWLSQQRAFIDDRTRAGLDRRPRDVCRHVVPVGDRFDKVLIVRQRVLQSGDNRDCQSCDDHPERDQQRDLGMEVEMTLCPACRQSLTPIKPG